MCTRLGLRGDTMKSIAGRAIPFAAAALSLFIIFLNLKTTAFGKIGLITLAGLFILAAMTALLYRLDVTWRPFPLILAATSFILKLFVVLYFDTKPISDFELILNAAKGLNNGDFSYLGTDYFSRWAYQSVFMAYEAGVLKLSSVFVLKLLNIIYMTGTDILVFLIAGKLFSKRSAAFASFFYLIYPAPVLLSTVLTNQHLSAMLIYAGIYLFLNCDGKSVWKKAISAGTLVSLGNAIRPDGIIALISVLLCAAAYFTARRNDNKDKYRVIKMTSGFLAAYFIISAAASYGVVKSGLNPAGLSNGDPLWKFVVGLNRDTSGVYSDEDASLYRITDLNVRRGKYLETIKERLILSPKEFLSFMLTKNRVMWAAMEDTEWALSGLNLNLSFRVLGWELTLNEVLAVFLRADKIIYLFTWILFFISVCTIGKRGPDFGHMLLMLFVITYICALFAVEIQVRYRYLIMPAVFILGSGALETFKFKNRIIRRILL